jgi:hypothetical protein
MSLFVTEGASLGSVRLVPSTTLEHRHGSVPLGIAKLAEKMVCATSQIGRLNLSGFEQGSTFFLLFRQAAGVSGKSQI